MKVVFPDIGMIGSMNWAAVERLIQFIFGTPYIKEFQKLHTLRSVLEKFSAAVIIRQRHILEGCGSTNQVSSALIECAENAKIVDVNYPLVPPFGVLLLWSKRLEDNWGEALKLTEL